MTYTNYLVRISTTKRVLTGFSMKIKIKKNAERIKNIIELKCNIELEIRFKTQQITHIAHVFMKLQLCTSQVMCTCVNKILGVGIRVVSPRLPVRPWSFRPGK